MIVLDASAVVEWLLQTVKADAVEARAFSKTTTSQRWHAPHLLDVEVAQALRRLVAAGHVSSPSLRRLIARS